MLTSAQIGKPFLWKSGIYGDIAVHVAGISPNGKVAVLSIDGGEASTPAQRFPVLSDGIGYATIESGDIVKRPATRTRKSPIRKLAEEAGVVPNRARRRRTNEEVF